MDRPTLISKFHELSDQQGEFSEGEQGVLLFKRWNWDYEQALAFQKVAHLYIQDHATEKIMILCNHPTCFTMGRGLQKKAGKVIEGLVPTDDFSQLPFPLHKINRGGGLTYHYPGQLIVYPILRLGGKNPSLSELSDLIFDALIKTTEQLAGISLSKKRGDLIGLWSEGIPAKKVASFGIGIERFITQHGVAFNVSGGEIFDVLGKMHPCGLQGSTYTYLNQLIDKEITVEKFATSYLSSFFSNS